MKKSFVWKWWLLVVVLLAASVRVNANKMLISSTDGIYQIGNAEDLVSFANLVNGGETSARAVLTADIDLTGVDFPMIGTSSIQYSGTFDGQYHTVTLNQTATQSYYGLFCIINGATIKNLRTAGDIQTSFNLVGGICGQMLFSTIEKCVSSVNIISSVAGDAASGGITGWIYNSVIKDCVFNGSISGESAMNCAGFAGWNSSTASSITNCLQISEINIAAEQGDTYNLFRNPTGIECTNVYYLNPVANTNANTIQITKEQLASGKICYLLNGEHADIQWTQTIGEDDSPVPFPTGKTVYADGEIRCDGKIIGNVTFTNTPCALPKHEYIDGVCVNCGQILTTEIVDGYYQITNADQLVWFANKVNSGENTINARLTADIDLTGIDFPMIGTTSIYYSGIFDGQYHTVTLNQTATQGYYGLFCIINGATIKNLRTAGDIQTAFNLAGGICGQMILSTIENCISSVNIISSVAGDAASGGITGWIYNSVIKDCVFNGSISGESAMNCAGFAGWSTSTVSYVTNCLQIAEINISSNQGDTYNISRNPSTILCTNVYYLNPVAGTNTGTIQITKEQLASGEACFLLNGDQKEIQWTQTIGEDVTPVPFPIGKTVYAQSGVRCDGKVMENAVFTNTLCALPEHEYKDGFCVNCGLPLSVEIVDGFYQISNTDQLVWFANKVNSGENTIKAQLTADIDLTGIDFPMIGTASTSYSGIFDGQYHTVTLNQTATQSYYGLFCIINGATIKNLRTAGDVQTAFNLTGGICGQMILSTIDNCVSSVNIISSFAGDAAYGGITGWIYNCVVKNSVFNGSISGESVINCGGFAGWNTSSASSITNCLQIAEINLASDPGEYYNIIRNPAGIVCTNVYYLNPAAYTNAGTIQITKDQLTSGELCYLLNGNQTNIQWTQTIGDESTLLPFPGKQVFLCGNEYINVETDEDFASFKKYVIEAETAYCKNVEDNMVVNNSLIDQYMATVDQLSECTVFADFNAIYNSLPAQRQKIQKSAEAYAEYIAKVGEAKAYLDENSGIGSFAYESLYFYMTEYEEPGELYPHGTASYIVDVAELNEEELKQEISKIEELLYQITLANATPGTDVTMLLANPDFSDGFNGWSGQLATSCGSSGTSPIKAAECNGRTMNMFQTISGIKNGIYELRINGAFRPYSQLGNYSTNYAAMLYANGNRNYFQANIEGMINESDAVDGWNCHITGDNPDVIVEDNNGVTGYVLGGIEGCCNAFQAGRYQNAILANVTDGTLTVGINQPGTGNQSEWLGFGNIQLIYCGTIEEADENINHVIESQVARANTILNKYKHSTGIDYTLYPNFSQEIKDELKSAVDAARTITDSNEKYALIETFSDLFQKVYESKKDYIKLMAQYMKIEELYATLTEFLDENERNEMDALLETILNGYDNGTFSKEECEENYLLKASFMPQKQDDGNFYIGNGKELLLFSIITNNTDPTNNAVLTADIDLTNFDFPMIGTSSTQYSGTFDGQYHTVTLSQTATQPYYSLFGFINNATIKNLRTAGEIHTEFNLTAGICGQMLFGTIENCVSSVNIISSLFGDAAYGGIAGWIYNGVIKNCVFNGSISGATVVNCGGFAGWNTSSPAAPFTNCLQISEFNISEDQGDTYNVSRNPSAAECTNVYYLNPVANINPGTIQITKEQLASGEVCYLLNGDQTDIQWTQTIGEDDFPIPFPTRKTVSKADDGTYVNSENALHEIEDGTEKSRVSGIYNLMGQKVEKVRKGIYIMDGKKFIQK